MLGADAAEQYALVLAESGLTPPLAGIMRMLTAGPGLSQQQLAERLRTAPSRIVSYVDDLAGRGWLTEHAAARELPGRLAAARGIAPGVHPSHRQTGTDLANWAP